MTAKRLLTKLQLKSQAEQSILLESLCKSRLEEILLFAKPLFSYAKKFARQLGKITRFAFAVLHNVKCHRSRLLLSTMGLSS